MPETRTPISRSSGRRSSGSAAGAPPSARITRKRSPQSPGRFDDVLAKAIQTLLATPVVDGEIELRPKVVTYAFADPRLEALSPAQKHFLRMGPRNVRLIQGELRTLAGALGVPEGEPRQ